MKDNNAEKWETDAGKISNYDSFNELVYRNGIINEFLNGNSKHFIIAGKGVGKTLLLSYKRYLLEKKYSNEQDRSNVTFVPKSHPYVDYIESIKEVLSKTQLESFRNWEYCKKFWTFIIELSSISYAGLDMVALLKDLPMRAARQKRQLQELIKTARTIEYIFNELVSMGETELIHFMGDTSNFIGEVFKNIHTPIIFFFDRIDQALENSHDSIWISIQAGLIEAAWDIMRNNSHIKIYLSIRQEAYAAHSSRNAHAISGEVVIIKYTEIELKELLDKLVSYYEGEEKLEDFIGLNYFQNTTIIKHEPVFSFMNRYSIGRPRDYVTFCNQLSVALKAKYKNEVIKRNELKNTIIKASSDSIVKSIHDEVRMLLKCLTTLEYFNQFVVLLNYNILTYEEIQSICKAYNNSGCEQDCSKCPDLYHPFCDLYNMGLLGVIEIDPASGKKQQKFKSPYDNMRSGLRGKTDFFLIHPALRNYISDLHVQTQRDVGYQLLDDILIGDGLPWNEKLSSLVEINKIIMLLSNKEVSEFFRNERHIYATHKKYCFPSEKFNAIGKDCDKSEKKIIDRLIQLLTERGEVHYEKTSVFVSYTYESEEHKRKVESFTNMLRKMGFEADMDSSLLLKYPNLDEMMSLGLQRDKVIVVLSKKYKEKADGHYGGVWKEFQMIANDLESNHQKYIFVSFDTVSENASKAISPVRIGCRWILDLKKGKEDNYNELVSYLTDEEVYPFAEVNKNTSKVIKKTISSF